MVKRFLYGNEVLIFHNFLSIKGLKIELNDNFNKNL